MDTPTLIIVNLIIFVITYIMILWLFELFGIIDWLYRVGFKLGQYIKKFVHIHDQSPEDPIEKYNRLPVYINGELVIDWVSIPEYQDGEWTLQSKTNGMYTLINSTPHLMKNNQPAYPKINFIFNRKWDVVPRQLITQIPNVPYYVGYVYTNSIVYNIN